jgi:hypothetical protein
MTIYIHLLAFLIFSLEIRFKQLCSVLILYANSVISHTKRYSNIGEWIFNIEKLHFKINKVTLLRELYWILDQVYKYLLDSHFVNENNYISRLVAKDTDFYPLKLSFDN